MNLSDSDDDEFFDAIDDSIPLPQSHSSEIQYFPSKSPTLPKRKSLGTSKVPEPSFTDLCTGSTFIYDTGRLDSRMLPFASGLTPVEVRTNKKDFREFSGLHLAQDITVTRDSGVMRNKFSPDGRFLAVSCESGVINLYEVARERTGEMTTLPLLKPQPYQVLQEHTGPVLDMSWEPSSTYLLSAGSDALVLLWRVDSASPLFRFPHPAPLTSIAFHPSIPTLFSTGSLDSKLRLWSTQHQVPRQEYPCADCITALAYSPRGEVLYVGLRLGEVIIMRVDSDGVRMTEEMRLRCRNRRGLKAKGRKVTGIEFFDENCKDCVDENCLISTNDSRGRFFVNTRMAQKYKGHKASDHNLRLSFSHNSLHVISGSENGLVHIWNLYSSYVPIINPK